jgi:hypothetical protein
VYRVEVVKQCGCFTKSGLSSEYSYDSLAEASKKAEELAKQFNDDFCGKHKFKVENAGNTIKVIEDEDADC